MNWRIISRAYPAATASSARRTNRRGAALVMAVVTLFLLLAIAVPFVLVTGHQEASAIAYRDRIEARLGAESARDHALAGKSAYNRLLQFSRWAADKSQGGGQQGVYSRWSDPFTDSLEEFDVDVARGIAADFGAITDSLRRGSVEGSALSWLPAFSAADQRRQIWSAHVEDEQGKINPNAATPALLGNLLGSGIVEMVEGYSDDATVTVSEGGDFFPLQLGCFVLSGYLCTYQMRVGNIFQQVNFNGVYSRNYLTASNDGDAGALFLRFLDRTSVEGRFGGDLVLPLAAHLIVCQRLIGAGQREPWRYESPDQIRSIAELNLFQPYEGLLEDALPPVLWMGARGNLTTLSAGSFDNGYFYPQIAQVSRQPGEDWTTISPRTSDVLNPAWLEQHDPRRGTRQLPAGVVTRLRYPGEATFYALSVDRRQVVGPALPPVTLSPLVRPIMEFQELAPVNVNTASWEVLVALFKGLRDPGQVYVINSATAETIAGAIQHVIFDENAPRLPQFALFDRDIEASANPNPDQARLQWGALRHLNDLDRVLQLLETARPPMIPNEARRAVMNCMRTPYGSYQEVPIVTAPVCFSSITNAVSLDAMATTFAQAGIDTARARFIESVELGSDGPGEWQWLDHPMLANERSRPQGNVFELDSVALVNDRLYGRLKLPWLLSPDSLVAAGRATLRVNSNATLEPMNISASRGFYDQQTLRLVNIADGTPGGNTEVGDMTGGDLAFWYELPAGFGGANDQCIFDVAEQEYSNRLSLLWWGRSRRQGRLQGNPMGLALRIKDRTLEPAFTVCHLDPDPAVFRPGMWYHFNARWKGTHLSHLNLLVDGVSERGKSPVETDHVFMNAAGAWEARTSRLRSQVLPQTGNAGLGGSSNDTIEIDPTDIGAFPATGCVRIGDEAIEYYGKTATGFTDLRRGARGTSAPAQGTPPYPAGSKVTIFGYATTVRSHPTTPYLPSGGARLADDMSGSGIYRVTSASQVSDDAHYAGNVIGPATGGPTNGTFLPLDTTAGLPDIGVLFVQGPCWHGYMQDPALGKQAPAIDSDNDGTLDQSCIATIGNQRLLDHVDGEYIVFRRTGGGVTITQRFDMSFNPKPASANYHFMAGWKGATPDDQLSVQGGYAVSGSIALLVSVRGSQRGSYHDPQSFTPPTQYSHIQIDSEWLTYHRLLGASGAWLFVYSDSNSLDAAAMLIAGDIAAGNPPQRLDGFREQGQNGPPAHGPNADIVPTFFVDGVRAGPGERVTVLHSPNQNKQDCWIRRVQNSGTPFGQIIALTSNVPFDYPAGSSEVLRFPTGELPRGIPTVMHFGEPYVAAAPPAAAMNVGGVIDELTFNRYNVLPTFKIVQDVSRSQRDEIVVDRSGRSMPDTCGMVLVEDELFVYRGKQYRPQYAMIQQPPGSGNIVRVLVDEWWALLNPIRGVLGTKAEAHVRGSTIMNFSGFPVFTVPTGIAPDEHQVAALGGEASPEPFGFMRAAPGNGATASQAEIFAYTLLSGTPWSFQLTCGDYRPGGALPLFRGCYGTAPRNWDSETVVTQFPVRQPDYFPRWMRGAGAISTASPEIAFVQAGECFPNARPGRLTWYLELPADPEFKRYMGCKLLVRFDGQPDWTVAPSASGPVYAWEFDWLRAKDATVGNSIVAENEIDFGAVAPGPVRRIEWRAYMYFRDGAYESDYWKHTLAFRGACMEMDSETRILSHEELR